MKIFTVIAGRVTEGTWVEKFYLEEKNEYIPAIIIGEGDYSVKGILPVILKGSQREEWQRNNKVLIKFGKLAKDIKEKFTLTANAWGLTYEENALCVFRSPVGIWGSNDHRGGIKFDPERDEFYTSSFPGDILVQGTISLGEKAECGRGKQLIAVMPIDFFSVSYTGLTLGYPSEHYFYFDGKKIVKAFYKENKALFSQTKA